PAIFGCARAAQPWLVLSVCAVRCACRTPSGKPARRRTAAFCRQSLALEPRVGSAGVAEMPLRLSLCQECRSKASGKSGFAWRIETTTRGLERVGCQTCDLAA